MRTDAFLRRLSRAKEKAAADLSNLGYAVFLVDDKRISVIAVRQFDVRLIRICLDEITAHDRKAVAGIKNQYDVEFWLRAKGRERFAISKA